MEIQYQVFCFKPYANLNLNVYNVWLSWRLPLELFKYASVSSEDRNYSTHRFVVSFKGEW